MKLLNVGISFIIGMISHAIIEHSFYLNPSSTRSADAKPFSLGLITDEKRIDNSSRQSSATLKPVSDFLSRKQTHRNSSTHFQIEQNRSKYTWFQCTGDVGDVGKFGNSLDVSSIHCNSHQLICFAQISCQFMSLCRTDDGWTSYTTNITRM